MEFRVGEDREVPAEESLQGADDPQLGPVEAAAGAGLRAATEEDLAEAEGGNEGQEVDGHQALPEVGECQEQAVAHTEGYRGTGEEGNGGATTGHAEEGAET